MDKSQKGLLRHCHDSCRRCRPLAVIPQIVFNRWSDEIGAELEESASEMVEFILSH